MKKIIALLLALVMCFALVACGGGGNDTKPADTTPADTTPADTTPADTTPADTTPSDAEKTFADTVGYRPDEADHFARDPYKVAFIVTSVSDYTQIAYDYMSEWGEKVFNMQIDLANANDDYDVYVTNIETYAVMGYDGMFIDAGGEINVRAAEVADELGVIYCTAIVPLYDDDGNVLHPSCSMNCYNAGVQMINWFEENVPNYWGDTKIDDANVGYIDCTFSMSKDFRDRTEGMQDRFLELHPNKANDMFLFDAIVEGFTPDAAYNGITPILTSNTQYDHWIIASISDRLATGATRAAEELGMNDGRILIACVDGNLIMSNWDDGYSDDCWVMGIWTPEVYQMQYCMAGLTAMLDGRATAENLWSDKWSTPSGYSMIYMPPYCVTRDNYKDLRAEALAYIDHGVETGEWNTEFGEG
jgi:DNA-binding LacI/PurR family transcriptional regulator/predicted small lipoprotein YifL